MRNAELSQQLRSLQQSSGDDVRALEGERAALEAQLAGKTQLEAELRDRCVQLEGKVATLNLSQRGIRHSKLLLSEDTPHLTSLIGGSAHLTSLIGRYTTLNITHREIHHT